MTKLTNTSPEKKKTVRSTSAASTPALTSIDSACETILQKLQALGIEEKLQADIQWCLGSYRNDLNPTGLYDMGKKAISVLQDYRTQHPKAVTAKFITDLEKALKK
jgi:hypothetical protein